MTGNVGMIVLNVTKFGENTIIVHTLTREFGRKGFMVRTGSRAPMALFQPMNILEADVTENPKSSLWRARNFTSFQPLLGIRNNIYKNTMTMFMSEVLYRVIKEGISEDGLYDWCCRSILTLDALESDFSNYHLWFLLELATELGFSPSIEGIGPFIDGYYGILKEFMESSFEKAMLLPMSGAVRNSLMESILKYLEFHTESAINVRSLKVLRELYK